MRVEISAKLIASTCIFATLHHGIWNFARIQVKLWYIIGITPDQTMVYAEFYHGLRLLPQAMVKFCVYRGLGGGFSYSNMTDYFKLNNYYKF